jgi:hypothetical protein
MYWRRIPTCSWWTRLAWLADRKRTKVLVSSLRLCSCLMVSKVIWDHPIRSVYRQRPDRHRAQLNFEFLNSSKAFLDSSKDRVVLRACDVKNKMDTIKCWNVPWTNTRKPYTQLLQLKSCTWESITTQKFETAILETHHLYSKQPLFSHARRILSSTPTRIETMFHNHVYSIKFQKLIDKLPLQSKHNIDIRLRPSQRPCRSIVKPSVRQTLAFVSIGPKSAIYKHESNDRESQHSINTFKSMNPMTAKVYKHVYKHESNDRESQHSINTFTSMNPPYVYVTNQKAWIQ